MDVIMKRASIRKYLPDPVSEEDIDGMIRAGMAAPSAHNRQPWHFIIITERTLLEAIPNIHPYTRMLLTAPTAIVVCGTHKELEENPFMPQDLAAATQNILLEATDRGLGSCWCGVYPKESLQNALSELLGLPKAVVPFSIIALGKPAETKKTNKPYDSLRIHRNGW